MSDTPIKIVQSFIDLQLEAGNSDKHQLLCNVRDKIAANQSKQLSLVEQCAKIADAEFHAAARAQITSGPTDYNRGSKNTALIIRNEIRALQSIKG